MNLKSAAPSRARGGAGRLCRRLRGAQGSISAKWLRSRALISDAISKGFNQDWSTTTPGFGEDAHQEGYNILFGDYSVRWYSDVEKRIIYWDTPTTGLLGDHWKGLGDSTHYASGISGYAKSYDEYHAYCRPRKDLTPLVWHIIDDWSGIDNGVAYDYADRTYGYGQGGPITGW